MAKVKVATVTTLAELPEVERQGFLTVYKEFSKPQISRANTWCVTCSGMLEYVTPCGRFYKRLTMADLEFEHAAYLLDDGVYEPIHELGIHGMLRPAAQFFFPYAEGGRFVNWNVGRGLWRAVKGQKSVYDIPDQYQALVADTLKSLQTEKWDGKDGWVTDLEKYAVVRKALAKAGFDIRVRAY